MESSNKKMSSKKKKMLEKYIVSHVIELNMKRGSVTFKTSSKEKFFTGEKN
jgi:hypothetical protein